MRGMFDEEAGLPSSIVCRCGITLLATLRVICRWRGNIPARLCTAFREVPCDAVGHEPYIDDAGHRSCD
jgi:hypothetical protein